MTDFPKKVIGIFQKLVEIESEALFIVSRVFTLGQFRTRQAAVRSSPPAAVRSHERVLAFGGMAGPGHAAK